MLPTLELLSSVQNFDISWTASNWHILSLLIHQNGWWYVNVWMTCWPRSLFRCLVRFISIVQQCGKYCNAQQEITDGWTSSRVKSSAALHRAFNVDPLYLQHENAGVAIDYMVKIRVIASPTLCLFFQHWQVPLSRRFRALKLWFVIRSFGVEGLQKHIRNVRNGVLLHPSSVGTRDLFRVIDMMCLKTLSLAFENSSIIAGPSLTSCESLSWWS